MPDPMMAAYPQGQGPTSLPPAPGGPTRTASPWGSTDPGYDPYEGWYPGYDPSAQGQVKSDAGWFQWAVDAWDWLNNAWDTAGEVVDATKTWIVEQTPAGRLAEGAQNIWEDVPDLAKDIIGGVADPVGTVQEKIEKAIFGEEGFPISVEAPNLNPATAGFEIVSDVLKGSSAGIGGTDKTPLGEAARWIFPEASISVGEKSYGTEEFYQILNDASQDNPILGTLADALITLGQVGVTAGAASAAAETVFSLAPAAMQAMGPSAKAFFGKTILPSIFTWWAIRSGVKQGAGAANFPTPETTVINETPPSTVVVEPTPVVAPSPVEPSPLPEPTPTVGSTVSDDSMQRLIEELSARDASLTQIVQEQADTLSTLEALLAGLGAGGARGAASAVATNMLSDSSGSEYSRPSGGGGPLLVPQGPKKKWKKKKKKSKDVRGRDIQSSTPDDKTSKDGRSSYGRSDV
jgi:hypothetical protein